MGPLCYGLLAGDNGDTMDEVEVLESEVGDLGEAGSSVDEHADECGVATPGERLAAARREQSLDLGYGRDGHRYLLDTRRRHLRHRGRVDFSLIDGPPEERSESTVAGCRSRR